MTQNDALDVLAALAAHMPSTMRACLREKPSADVRRLTKLIDRKIAQRAARPTHVDNLSGDIERRNAELAERARSDREEARADAELERMLREHSKSGGLSN